MKDVQMEVPKAGQLVDLKACLSVDRSAGKWVDLTDVEKDAKMVPRMADQSAQMTEYSMAQM